MKAARMVLTDEMKTFVLEQRLAYHATVNPDGTPNLSHKGTTSVYDDEHLFFADIRSPQTIANLHVNPAIEVNVVDIFSRRGYRFSGTATVHEKGDDVYNRGLELLRERDYNAYEDRIRSIENRPARLTGVESGTGWRLEVSLSLSLPRTPIEGGGVCWADGRVVEVRSGRAERRYPDAAIVPGFVNADSHVEYAVYAGFGDSLSFGPWIAHSSNARTDSARRTESRSRAAGSSSRCAAE